MNLCIDCRYLIGNISCGREQILDREKGRRPVLSPVDGQPIPFVSKAQIFDAFTRRTQGDCGMEAKLFEAKK